MSCQVALLEPDRRRTRSITSSASSSSLIRQAQAVVADECEAINGLHLRSMMVARIAVALRGGGHGYTIKRMKGAARDQRATPGLFGRVHAAVPAILWAQHVFDQGYPIFVVAVIVWSIDVPGTLELSVLHQILEGFRHGKTQPA